MKDPIWIVIRSGDQGYEVSSRYWDHEPTPEEAQGFTWEKDWEGGEPYGWCAHKLKSAEA